MSNILDLRNPPEEELEEAEVEAEAEVPDVDPTMEEPVFLSSVPEELSWEGHAPLSPSAWRRHYIALAAVAVVGVGVAVWQSSWLVFATLAVCVTTWEITERFSRPMSASVDSRGITLDGHRYPHATLTSFDIHRMQDGNHYLSVHAESWRMPRLRIPLGSMDPNVVHGVLSQHLPEGDHPVPLYDWWLRKP